MIGTERSDHLPFHHSPHDVAVGSPQPERRPQNAAAQFLPISHPLPPIPVKTSPFYKKRHVGIAAASAAGIQLGTMSLAPAAAPCPRCQEHDLANNVVRRRLGGGGYESESPSPSSTSLSGDSCATCIVQPSEGSIAPPRPPLEDFRRDKEPPPGTRDQPSCSSSHQYQSALSHSVCSGGGAAQHADWPKDGFVAARPSDDVTIASSIGCAPRLYDDRGSEGYGSEASEESSEASVGGSNINKPHKANDSHWEALQAVRVRDGHLGLSHFKLLKKLGSGDIGSVYLAELSGTRSYFAMKVMDKLALASKNKLPRTQIEREILQCLDHPFLPTLYAHFETDKFSCLIMEFCPGGDLHTLRQRQPNRHFSEKAARFYVAEVLLALEYLHMLGVIYRDLKPENVLVRDDGHIMLSDFDLSLRCLVFPTLVKSSERGASHSKNSGHCVQPSCAEPTCVVQPSCLKPACFTPFGSGKSKKASKAKPKDESSNQVIPLPELVAEPTSARSMSFVGTHEYLAPEIIKGEGHGSAVDWWTFGIFLYELLFGKTPFKGSGNRATLFNVVGEPLRFPESPVVSFAARDLIRGLLVKEPEHRLAYRRGATEVKQHPFFQSVNWALIRCASPPEVPRPFQKEILSAINSPKMPMNTTPSKTYLSVDFF